jgi:ribonucleotide reductase beta subunit family protein with ferritin-like domain
VLPDNSLPPQLRFKPSMNVSVKIDLQKFQLLPEPTIGKKVKARSLEEVNRFLASLQSPLVKFCGCRASVGSAVSYDMESVCVDCIPMFSAMHERSYANFLKNLTKKRAEVVEEVEDEDEDDEEEIEALERESDERIRKLQRKTRYIQIPLITTILGLRTPFEYH